MATRLSQIGKFLRGINSLLKTLRSFRPKAALLRDIGSSMLDWPTKVEGMQYTLPDAPELQELKNALRKGSEHLPVLLDQAEELLREAYKLENFLFGRVDGSSLSNEELTQFCELLKRMWPICRKFSNTIKEFIAQLGRAATLARQGEREFEQKAADLEREAASGRAAAGAAGVVGVLGLLALVVATGGAALAPVGAVGAGTATAVAAKTIDKRRQAASSCLSDSRRLNSLAVELQSCCDRAKNIRSDMDNVAALQVEFESYSRELENEEKPEEKDAELRKLEEDLQCRLAAKLQ